MDWGSGLHSLDAVGIGRVDAEVRLPDRQVQKIFLDNVLHVPNFQVNLLSVPVMEDNGLTVIFKDRKCSISKNDVLKAVADREAKNLYVLRMSV